jgi:solute carrier family 25 (adenine nucleotide translocator) protein 4/5/6/31
VAKGGKKQFNGIADVISQTVKGDGVRGIYRGVFSTFGGIGLYRAAYFGFYDLWRGYI